ncbi:MAG: uL15 family ribosomal protein [Candidatus Micrarchaeia archaeon]
MVRDRKKTGKFRGTRSQGKGNVKNRSGSGGRGGCGKSGRKKQKKSWVTKYAPDYFGRHGFSRTKKIGPAINLYEIERKIITGEIKKKGEKYYYEFSGKILGSGFINYPIEIKAGSWSKKAQEKVKNLSGEITSIKN